MGESGICIGSIKASFHVSLLFFLPHVPQLMTNLIGPAFDMLERLPHTHFHFSDQATLSQIIAVLIPVFLLILYSFGFLDF